MELVLKALRNLKHVAGGGEVDGFNFSPSCGICWHIGTNTLGVYNDEVLNPAFASMGLDENYPVERQFCDDHAAAQRMYWDDGLMKYATNTDTGKARLKLLDDLIVYYEKVLAQDPV